MIVAIGDFGRSKPSCAVVIDRVSGLATAFQVSVLARKTAAAPTDYQDGRILESQDVLGSLMGIIRVPVAAGNKHESAKANAPHVMDPPIMLVPPRLIAFAI